MKKKCAIAALIIVSLVTLACFSAGEDVPAEIEKLVVERFDALNQYYMGVASYSKTADKLYNIETGRLLAEDCGNLITFVNTDVECFKKFKVKDVAIKSDDGTLVCAEISVELEKYIPLAQNADNTTKENNRYSIICEKKDEKYKIVQFFYLASV